MPDVTVPPTSCAKCGGTEFYDNRADKAAGRGNPRGPDFRCKDKDCKEAYWLKPAAGGKAAAPARSAARQAIERPPLALASDGPEYGDIESQERAVVQAIQAGTYAPKPKLTWEELKAKHLECLDHAINVSKLLDDMGIGSDPQAVVAVAATMFIERNRQGC